MVEGSSKKSASAVEVELLKSEEGLGIKSVTMLRAISSGLGSFVQEESQESTSHFRDTECRLPCEPERGVTLNYYQAVGKEDLNMDAKWACVLTSERLTDRVLSEHSKSWLEQAHFCSFISNCHFEGRSRHIEP